jgi:uncharacterized protein (UPF0332 family)
MTDYSKLLESRRIAKGTFSRQQVSECLKIARRDIATAKSILNTSQEWAFNIAHNAMNQAGRALMLHEGYRPLGEGHHATVVQFLEIAFEGKLDSLLAEVDRIRRKRNKVTYDTTGLISRKNAEEAISIADELLKEVVKRIAVTPSNGRKLSKK